EPALPRALLLQCQSSRRGPEADTPVSSRREGHRGCLVLSVAVTTPDGGVSGVQSDMTFGHWNTTPHEGGECVFWNHSLRGGEGGWSPQGCQTSGAGNATSCSCQHLTSFSVLMSAHPVPASTVLTAVSRLGLCASVLALATALLTALPPSLAFQIAYFRYTTLANIASSLLMGSLWFLGAFTMTASHENGLCVAAAFFSHFFYLATFFWMLVQALTLFHQLVFVFHQLTISTVTPAMVAVGYGCPLAVAVATVATFFPRRSYLQESFCWLSAPSRAIHAFSVPVLAIVIVNALVLFVVLLKLMRPLGPEGSPGEDRRALLGIFKALLILTPVFGLTWVLGVITMTTDASTFTHYAFSILNSFQVCTNGAKRADHLSVPGARLPKLGLVQDVG
uniref:Uncharacterized protein n=1 Tax=Varanus komodoensis TaxID=61221 RepID=A0A8D2JI08_VARKO